MPDASFSTWTIVFLIAAVQGGFVALALLMRKRGQRLANRLLAVLLLMFSFTLFEYVMYWTNYIFRFMHLANLSAQLPYLFGPLVYLYLRTIYEQRPLSRRDLWHLLPFVIAVMLYLPWLMLDAATKAAITTGKAGFPISRIILQLLLWARVAHLFGYAVWNAWYLHQQPRVGKTARWARLINGFYLGFLLAYTSYFVLIRFPFFSLAWDYHISATMTAFIYLIAYAGYVQPAVFDGFDFTDPGAPVKYKNSSLTEEAGRSLLKKLTELMVQEQLYRNPELNLDALANSLDASKHHVSQIINEHIGLSFFEYINQLRIEDAKQLLAETSRSDLHVIEVAYAVGFNNKVSFNNAFKRLTGMTPTAFRKSHARTDDSSSGQPGAVGAQ
ncbi:MAG: helix-turn-helix domain-containing protein [Lewinellaceae bacterium]|nr:helix-turn-helix domain-containing protein [Lewinellaceae bacterium]